MNLGGLIDADVEAYEARALGNTRQTDECSSGGSRPGLQPWCTLWQEQAMTVKVWWLHNRRSQECL